MSRSKPYSRQSSGGKRDTDSAWKHDLHDSRPALLQRLGSGSPASSSSSSLKARLGLDSASPRGRDSPSYAGRELLPGNSGQAKGLRSDSISNAGKELLPAGGAGKNARSGRGSRPRGSNGNEGAAFAANALGSLRRDRSERTDRGDRDRRDKPVSIAGAARAWVRVEHLAPGTTGADVKVSSWERAKLCCLASPVGNYWLAARLYEFRPARPAVRVFMFKLTPVRILELADPAC